MSTTENIIRGVTEHLIATKDDLYNQGDILPGREVVPTRKVTVGTAGSVVGAPAAIVAGSAVLTYVLDVPVPDAITMALFAAVGGAINGIIGYFTKERS